MPFDTIIKGSNVLDDVASNMCQAQAAGDLPGAAALLSPSPSSTQEGDGNEEDASNDVNNGNRASSGEGTDASVGAGADAGIDGGLGEGGEGVRLLYRAAAEGDAAVVEQLLDAGVPVEGRGGGAAAVAGQLGNATTSAAAAAAGGGGVAAAVAMLTPLHVACAGGRDAVATALALLRRGANPGARARRGVTPLLLAAAQGPPSLLSALLLADRPAALAAVDEVERCRLTLSIPCRNRLEPTA